MWASWGKLIRGLGFLFVPSLEDLVAWGQMQSMGQEQADCGEKQVEDVCGAWKKQAQPWFPRSSSLLVLIPYSVLLCCLPWGSVKQSCPSYLVSGLS